MFEETKKLIIVSNKNTNKYANYLQQLISLKTDTNEDKNKIEAVVWSDKNYTDNKPTLSSDSYILFIGNNKMVKSECSFLERKFEGFGMNFKALGKRAVLYVDKEITTLMAYQKFTEYHTNYDKKLKEKYKKNKKNLNKIQKGIINVAQFIISPTIFLVLKSPAAKKVRQKLTDEQYCCLMEKFNLDYLQKFMEGYYG